MEVQNDIPETGDWLGVEYGDAPQRGQGEIGHSRGLWCLESMWSIWSHSMILIDLFQ